MPRLSKYTALIVLAFLSTQTATAQQARQFRPAGTTQLSAPASNASPTATSPFERPIYVASNPGETPSAGTAGQPTGSFAFNQTPINTTQTASPNLEQAGKVDGTDVAKIDLSDPEQAAAALKRKAEQGQNKLRQAWGGNRQAQLDLAKEYLLPVFSVLAVLFLANWIGNYARRLTTGFVSNHVDQTLGRFSGNAMKFAIMAIALMAVLGKFGFETTSIAAAVAALGFAVGMALQGTLGNFAAGIALLIFRPFNVGDYIVVDGDEGTVGAIELFTTTINTADNRHIIIPNDSVFGNKIENWTHNDSRRVDVVVGVAYSADMKLTRQVLSTAMQSVEGRTLDREPQIYLSELNASSVDWSCRVWCPTSDYLAVKERMTEAIKVALDQHKIEIPFPQLDLHVIAAAAQQKMAA